MATYRTKSGRNVFGFKPRRMSDGEVRVYVTRQPSYGGRSTDGHSTHRYTDDSGRKYICREPGPRSLSDARKVAKGWAEGTEGYIRTGRFGG